jgi:hypothetical protein
MEPYVELVGISGRTSAVDMVGLVDATLGRETDLVAARAAALTSSIGLAVATLQTVGFQDGLNSTSQESPRRSGQAWPTLRGHPDWSTANGQATPTSGPEKTNWS